MKKKSYLEYRMTNRLLAQPAKNTSKQSNEARKL